MLIETRKRSEEAVGIKKDIRYTIENGPHMMQILSGLYTNPASALVREYLTNMYDAHIALYKATGSWGETPTLVLPTVLSPTIKFIDKGIGMSLETVENIFTRYGRSTKSNSNDEVGGFGLGAKVAFCYNGGVDWTVDTIHDGQRHLFVARIGTEDMPVLSYVHTEETQEHSGTTITIPVSAKDVDEIVETAYRLLPFFPMEIKVENAEVGDDMLKMPDPIYQGSNWKAYGISHKGALHQLRRQYTFPMVLIGNVPYEINMGNIADAMKLSSYEARKFFESTGVVITIPVGAVDLVPSRDSLKYTDRTKNYLVTALETFFEELKVKLTDTLAHCKTRWEATLEFSKMKDFTGLQDVMGNLTWKGGHIGSSIYTVDLSTRTDMTIKAVAVKDYRAPKVEDSPWEGIMTVQVTEDYDIFDRTGEYYIVLDDVKRGGIKVARSFADAKFIERDDRTNRIKRWGSNRRGIVYLVTTNLTVDELSTILEGVPTDRFYKASEISTNLVVRALPSAENIYRWTGTTWAARVNIPDNTDVKYYLPLTKTHNGRWWYKDSHDKVRSIIERGTQLGLGQTIFGFRKDDVADLDTAIWKNYADEVARLLDPASHGGADEIRKAVAYYQFVGRKSIGGLSVKNLASLKDVNSDFANLADLIVQEDELHTKHYNYICMIGYGSGINPYNPLVSLGTITEDMSPAAVLLDEVLSKYPMLNFVYNYGSATKEYMNAIRDYIKMVDPT